MKQYIKKDILNIDIEVVFEMLNESVAATTTITPVLTDKDEIDVAAMSKYIEFVEAVEEIIEYYDFVELDRYRSNSKPKTSFYSIYAYKPQVDANDVPKMIRLRLSDHIQSLNDSAKQVVKDRLKAKLDEVKIPKSKIKQRYIPVEIVVNDTVFNTYEDALEYVENEVRSWMVKLGLDLSRYEPFGKWS